MTYNESVILEKLQGTCIANEPEGKIYIGQIVGENKVAINIYPTNDWDWQKYIVQDYEALLPLNMLAQVLAEKHANGDFVYIQPTPQKLGATTGGTYFNINKQSRNVEANNRKTKFYNTSIGYSSGYEFTPGSHNIAIGRNSLDKKTITGSGIGSSLSGLNSASILDEGVCSVNTVHDSQYTYIRELIRGLDNMKSVAPNLGDYKIQGRVN